MKKRPRDVILFMGTYPPRECGIATFTRDLTTAVNKTIAPKLETKILAINKNGSNIYNYPKNVIYQISDNDVDDYIQTAKLINRDNKIKLVCIQHEFGIFGGEYGDHLLAFLEILEKPVVLTFHSVLPGPNDRLRKAVIALAERVQTIVVMTKTGVDILRRDYELTTPIKVIPHGIPTVKFETQKREKRQLGFKDRIILSSFGLMSCGKGYEVVIESLPEIVKRFPKLLYLIVGETHPVVRKHEGEEYRNFLEDKVKELGLQKNVKFYNKYLTLDEIIQYLKASDVYISSSKDPNQITSGTLSYAMGCGRSVVSTPFIHAKDAVKKDKGLLVEFDNPSSFSKAIISILSSRKTRRSMEEHAYHHSRSMTWPNVALSYDKVFRENLKIPVTHDLPEINTAHLEKLTDDFGVIQFAKQSDPDIESGYTLDDNARALLTCAMHYKHSKQFKTLNLVKTYLDYIKFVQGKDGKLYNQVDKDKRIDYKNWSDDAHGRAIWTLGRTYATESIPEDLKAEAEKILTKAAPIALKITSPRAIAFSLLGLCAYNKEKKDPRINYSIKKLADYLVQLHKAHSSNKWNWFERYLTYANSKLPESLFAAYKTTGDKNYLSIAQSTLNFLISKTFEKGVFVPIGQRAWYIENGERSYFDQQPVEAAYMVQTLLTAYRATGNPKYKRQAITAFNWFLGRNTLNQVVYSEGTGGCYDGLGESTININQGAESTISYLMARLSLTQT